MRVFHKLISNFQTTTALHASSKKGKNRCAKKKRRTVPGTFFKGVHKRQSQSDGNNNTITNAGLLLIILRISFQKQHFLPFFYLLFSLLLPPVLHAPPCLSTKPIKGSWVLVRSLEQARGGVRPRDRADDFIPELDARAWGDELEGGMKAERWMQQSPSLCWKAQNTKRPPPLQGRMTSGHPLPSPPHPPWLSSLFNMKHFVIKKKKLPDLLNVKIWIIHRLSYMVF